MSWYKRLKEIKETVRHKKAAEQKSITIFDEMGSQAAALEELLGLFRTRYDKPYGNTEQPHQFPHGTNRTGGRHAS